MAEDNLPTVYNNSAPCPECGDLMDPVQNLFSGSTGMCASCRNKEYTKQAKSAMSGGR